jgi:hypothetical protein
MTKEQAHALKVLEHSERLHSETAVRNLHEIARAALREAEKIEAGEDAYGGFLQHAPDLAERIGKRASTREALVLLRSTIEEAPKEGAES